MKCEKCGKNEARFYYSSNINGKTTEKHLCEECAAEFENSNDYRNVFGGGGLFDEMNNMFNSFGSFFGRSALAPFEDFGFGMPAMIMPRMRSMLDKAPEEMQTRAETAQKNEVNPRDERAEKKQAVDPEISKRRRINELKHQMKMAAHNEDYEKAAELRDQIKEIEKDNK